MTASLVRQRIRASMVLAAILVAGWALYTARGALPPFLLGSVFVLAVAPIVDRVARGMPFYDRHPDFALALGILLLYWVVAGTIVTIAVLFGPTVLREGRDLANGLPSFVERAQREVQDNNGWYQRNVPVDIRLQIDRNWQQVADKAGGYAQEVLRRSLDFATTSVTTVAAYLVVPFWAFFVLKDREKGARAIVRLFPASVQPDVVHLLAHARTVFGSYVRAQLVLSTATGVITAIGLTWLDVRFAIVLGATAGIANLIPVLGPMIGGIPALIVVTATHPGWSVLWVFLFLFVAQELKDFILVPRIQGRAVGLHPAVILVLIVVAGHIAGFWGLLFAVPVVAVLRDGFTYVYHRLTDENCAGASLPHRPRNSNLEAPAITSTEQTETVEAGELFTAGSPRPG